MSKRTLWTTALLLVVSGLTGFWLTLTGGPTAGVTFFAGAVFGAALLTVAGEL